EALHGFGWSSRRASARRVYSLAHETPGGVPDRVSPDGDSRSLVARRAKVPQISISARRPRIADETSQADSKEGIDASGGDLGLQDGPAQTLKTFVWVRWVTGSPHHRPPASSAGIPVAGHPQ